MGSRRLPPWVRARLEAEIPARQELARAGLERLSRRDLDRVVERARLAREAVTRKGDGGAPF